MPASRLTLAHQIDPRLAQAVASWSGEHPLSRLRAALVGHVKRKAFLDSCAEAAVAHHLVERGCDLRFEVPTPAGRACDFAVTHGDVVFYLHVKRLSDRKAARRKLTISSRLRYLERLPRPYVVSVRWRENASESQMQRLVTAASEFILQARIGDELAVHDDTGAEVGGVLVLAPWEGDHVSLAIGLPSGFTDAAPRMRRLLSRAYQQFMPRATNLILLASSHADEHDDLTNALLGAHIERWDQLPPRGQRIAFGRAADGFWHGQRYVDSRVVGWFRFDPHDATVATRLWYRGDGPEAEARSAISTVLGGAAGDASPD